jgi:hypothetical protein
MTACVEGFGYIASDWAPLTEQEYLRLMSINEPVTVIWAVKPEIIDDGEMLDSLCLHRGTARDMATFEP